MSPQEQQAAMNRNRRACARIHREIDQYMAEHPNAPDPPFCACGYNEDA